jgi:hypothetical protein
MTSTTLTANQSVRILVGRKAMYLSSPFRFPVTIIDAKMALGQIAVKIRPIGGSGECWTSVANIQLQPE